MASFVIVRQPPLQLGIKLISNKLELNVGATSLFYNDGLVMQTNALKKTI